VAAEIGALLQQADKGTILLDIGVLLALCCSFLHMQTVRVDEILGADKAKEVIEEAIQMYVDNYVPKKYRVTK
jgi:hypothetical protein